MGYTRKFTGSFKLSRRLTSEEISAYESFLSNAVNYYVENDNTFFEEEYYVFRYPTTSSPWIVNTDRKSIRCVMTNRCGTLFIDWLTIIIDEFFEKLGVTLSGRVTWSGEDKRDKGIITICDSVVNIDDGNNLEYLRKKTF